ncbi:MAG: DUF4383 domain-containing protein [Cyanobacteria bacterium P01_A01_bin.83]
MFYLAIAVLGTVPVARTVFGIMPIFGNNIWFNGLTGAIATYYGFFGKNQSALSDQVNV